MPVNTRLLITYDTVFVLNNVSKSYTILDAWYKVTYYMYKYTIFLRIQASSDGMSNVYFHTLIFFF